MGTDSSNLEEAVREISREISSEFSCARDITDPGSSPGQLLSQLFGVWTAPCYELNFSSACIRCGYRVVKRCEKEDSAELLYPRAICSYPLFPQQWAESANALPLAHPGLVPLRLHRRGLSARPSLLWFSVGHWFFTTGSWEDAPSRAEVVPFPLGRRWVVTEPLRGNRQLCRQSKPWGQKSTHNFFTLPNSTNTNAKPKQIFPPNL